MSLIFRHRALAGVLLAQLGLHLFVYTSAGQVGLLTIPWLLNRGGTLYGDVLEHRAPVLAWLMALAGRVVPLDPAPLLLLLDTLLVLGVSVAVYALALRLTARRAGALAALLTWVWWSPSYGNVRFYYDSVLGALLLGAFGLWLALRGRAPRWTPFAVGLVLGAGVLVKQHGGAAVVLVGLWLLATAGRGRWRAAVGYSAGVLALPLVVVAYQAAIGNLGEFFYWTVTFNLSGDVPPLPPTSAFVYKMLLTHALLPVFVLFTLREPRPARTLLLALWLAGTATLVPKFGEIHTMALLPVLAVLSGWAVADLLPTQPPARWGGVRAATPAALGLAGVGVAVAGGWLWAGLLTAVPTAVGRGATLAYDEFLPLAALLGEVTAPGDTLAVLPALDGNPQLHIQAGLLPPPGVWTTTHDCMLCAPGLTERLLADWDAHPPTWVVLFPELINPRQNIDPLLAYVAAEYVPVMDFAPVPFNGAGTLYRHRDAPG